MSKEMKILPELRFPEFENDGSWENVSLEDVADIIKGKQLNRLQLSESGTYPCLNGGISPSGYTDKFNTEANTITISEGGNSCGFVSYMTTKFWLGGHCYRIDLKKSTSLEFFYQLLKANELRIMRLRVGSGLPNIQKGTLLSLRMPFVSNPDEQQKIASCLSSLDELLTAHNDKLEALKDHKKGLMQNLFPQQGETVPKVRFPEFEDDGEWNETTLVQVADYENGKAHEKDIDEDGNYIVVNSKFISTEGETVKYSNTAFCPASEGDILMVLSDIPNGKAIAKCFYVDEDDKYSVNQRICRITATNCDSRFLFYIMDRNAYFLSFDDGVKQTNLRKSDVLEFPFRIPTDPVEQTKIASCISAVDDLIKSQSAKIEELNQHKRGLMQGLFPEIEN